MSENVIRSFRNRWNAVAAIELKERREATIDQRWRQLNWIAGVASLLDLAPAEPDPQVEVVRQRWAKLRRAG